MTTWIRRILTSAVLVVAFGLLAWGVAHRGDAAAQPATPCDADTPEVCHDLAIALDRGADGHLVDAARARTLYAEACQSGVLESCSNLGRLILYGQGGPEDLRRAGALFHRACESGVTRACTNLGVAHGRLGNHRDAVAAYDVACRARHARACLYLAQRYDAGRGVAEDPDTARQLYARACLLGYAPAC